MLRSAAASLRKKAMTNSIPNGRAISIAMLVTGLLTAAACGPRDSADEASSSPTGSAIDTSAAAGSGICALLTMAEAQAAFPEVTLTTPYTDLEKVGIQACDFGSKSAVRVFQVRLSKSSVDQEMTTFEAGVMDPAKQSQLTRDPFGAGGKIIVSEQGKTPDALGDLGVAALQKGPNTIVVSTSTVTGGHDVVEKHLIALVTAAASRAP